MTHDIPVPRHEGETRELIVALTTIPREPPRPADYPLPVHKPTGRAYWEINLAMCRASGGWRRWQAGKQMAEIIPVIDQQASN